MTYSICLLCGLPGAGKTTVAKELSKDQQSAEYKFIHVCYDLLMPAVEHVENLSNGQLGAWKSARQCILKNIDIMLSTGKIDQIDPSLKLDENIVQSEMENIIQRMKNSDPDNNIVMVIDDNMQYRGMRHEYYRLCAKLEIGFSIVYFDVPLETCISNNEARKYPVDEKVIKKLFCQMEIPGNHVKCKWEKYVCVLGNIDISNPLMCVKKIMELVTQSISDPAMLSIFPETEDVENSRQINRKNFIHQADLCMRKYVSAKMKHFRTMQPSSKELNNLSKKLVGAKQSLHALFKLGYVDENEFTEDDGIINTEKLFKKVSELLE